MAEETSQPKKLAGALSMSPEALERQRGEMDAADAAGMDLGDWRIKQRMAARGIAWTRENFIRAKWRGEPPLDEAGEPFIPEDEIPDDLR